MRQDLAMPDDGALPLSIIPTGARLRPQQRVSIQCCRWVPHNPGSVEFHSRYTWALRTSCSRRTQLHVSRVSLLHPKSSWRSECHIGHHIRFYVLGLSTCRMLPPFRIPCSIFMRVQLVMQPLVSSTCSTQGLRSIDRLLRFHRLHCFTCAR